MTNAVCIVESVIKTFEAINNSYKCDIVFSTNALIDDEVKLLLKTDFNPDSLMNTIYIDYSYNIIYYDGTYIGCALFCRSSSRGSTAYVYCKAEQIVNVRLYKRVNRVTPNAIFKTSFLKVTLKDICDTYPLVNIMIEIRTDILLSVLECLKNIPAVQKLMLEMIL